MEQEDELKHVKFARNLKGLMERRGFSQTTLAYATGTGKNNVGMWLMGRNLPSLDSLAKVRLVLDCTWDELLGAKGELVLEPDSVAMIAEEYRGR